MVPSDATEYRDKSNYFFSDPNIPDAIKRQLAQVSQPAAYEEFLMDLFY